MNPGRLPRIFCALILAALCTAAGAAAAGPDETAGDYRILGDESELRILVFSAGALGALGHNHVISSHALDGNVHVGPSPADSRFELSLPVASLVVDEPEARAAAGPAFEGEVGEEDRQGTRGNMLGDKLLDAARYPEVRILSASISGEFPRMTVHAQVEIKGSSHEVLLPASVAFYGDRLVAIGRAKVAHAELGLKPFSAALGTLRVADEIAFRYRIVARKE